MKLLQLVLPVLLLGAASTAHAQRLSILDLRFDGMAPAAIDSVRLRLQDTLAGLGYRVVDQVTSAFLLREAPPGCISGPCLGRVGRVLNVERALTGAVASHGSSYELTLTMLETGGGTVLAQVSQRCDVCNFKEVEGAAARAAERLHRQAQAVLAQRSSLTVSSVPSEAEVILDGLPHGPTPVKTLLAPGRHVVEAVARGLPPLRRKLELDLGEAKTLSLNLLEHRDSLEVTPPPSTARYPSWVKWSVLSGGLTLLSPGIVLWAVDDEARGLDTRPAGVAMVTIGGAAIVTAAVLWILERP